MAKLMLNSFGGKFGEKPNKTQTFTVISPGQLYRIIEESGNNIHDIRICTDYIVEVDDLSQMKDETAGVPIQEFVTGSPKKYSYMLQTGDTECKIRGFTLDEQGYALLKF